MQISNAFNWQLHILNYSCSNAAKHIYRIKNRTKKTEFMWINDIFDILSCWNFYNLLKLHYKNYATIRLYHLGCKTNIHNIKVGEGCFSNFHSQWVSRTKVCKTPLCFYPNKTWWLSESFDQLPHFPNKRHLVNLLLCHSQ